MNHQVMRKRKEVHSLQLEVEEKLENEHRIIFKKILLNKKENT
jgi:hypothetical protein